MIHLLIVDDEDLTVKRLQSSIDWNILGVDQVFTAFSMTQAKKIFLSEQIDIMLCDIEMPAGSGLDLLHWVREQGYPTINIFLTGHANFSYAKDALTLETMEYLLKPISFEEIKRVIKKSVILFKERQSETQNQRLAFFRQLAQGEILPLQDSILRTAQSMHVSIAPEETCIPVLAANKSNFQKQGTTGYWDTKPAVVNIATDSFSHLLCPPLLLARHILLLFPGETLEDHLFLELHSFQSTAATSLALEMLLCVGRKTPLEKLSQEITMLLQAERDNVKTEGIYTFPIQLTTSLFHNQKADYSLWLILLEQGNPQGVTLHVRQYLESNPNLTRESILLFYQTYLQMLGILLNKNQIPLQELESFFQESATQSLNQLLDWVENINQYICFLLSHGKDATVVERAKNYIEKHILGEINRNKVAESIHVSPEYLSRVFRQKTGRSLVEYITDTKMNAAQELLTHSDMPISQIASQLGYGNFSYFSQLFRDYFSLTPSAYRKKHSGSHSADSPHRKEKS